MQRLYSVIAKSKQNDAIRGELVTHHSTDS